MLWADIVEFAGTLPAVPAATQALILEYAESVEAETSRLIALNLGAHFALTLGEDSARYGVAVTSESAQGLSRAYKSAYALLDTQSTGWWQSTQFGRNYLALITMGANSLPWIDET